MTDIPPIIAASHQLCAALHTAHVNPNDIEIRLPKRDWWNLYCYLTAEYHCQPKYDGRGTEPKMFVCMGVVYRVKE